MQRTFAGGKGSPARQALLHFSIIYFLAIIIIVGLSVFSLSFFREELAEITKENHRLRISRSVDMLEHTLDEADAFFTTSITIEQKQYMQKRTVTASDMRTLIKKSLRRFTDSNDLIVRYYLFAAQSGTVLEPERGYLDPATYYEGCFRYGDLDTSQWLALMKSDQADFVAAAPAAFPQQAIHNSILYLRNYAINNRRYGKIVFYIDADELLKQLTEQIAQDYACSIWLANTRNEVLLSNTQEPLSSWAQQEQDASGWLALRQESAKHGFHLYVSCSQTAIGEYIAKKMLPLYLPLLLMLLLSAIAILWLWYSNHRPLQRAMEVLPSVDGGDSTRSGMWYLPMAVGSLNQNNLELLNQNRAQQDCLRAVAVHRMLSGDLHAAEELKLLLAQMDVHLEGKYCRGIFLRVQQGEEADAANRDEVDLEALLRESCGQRLQLISLYDVNVFALLYCSDTLDESRAEINSQLSKMQKNLCAHHFDRSCFFVGLPCSDVSELARSFATASERMNAVSLQRLEPEEWSIMVTKDHLQKGYALTEQQVRNLMNQTRAGNSEEVAQQLEQIRAENAGSTDSFCRKLLMARIVDILIEAGYTGELEQEMRWQLFSMHFSDFFERIGGYFETLCRMQQQNQSNRSSKLADSIIATIRSEFSNPDLSLSSISERFGVSEKRISTLLRDATGSTFQGYLEQLRIGHANQLLLDRRSKSVNQIAVECGYANDRTFRRAYVRVMGCAPSQYREDHPYRSVPDEIQQTQGEGNE